MRKRRLLMLAAALCCLPLHAQNRITSQPAPAEQTAMAGEGQMKDGMMQMLSHFATYIRNHYLEAQQKNSRGETYGCFRSNSTWKANEDGVRTNADLSMIAAFLCKYGPGRTELPAGVTWQELETMARRSLIYAYSTHKANRLATCEGGQCWGSTSANDHQWESSLWAMSVAYSAFFQWDKLTTDQRKAIECLLKAECSYELERTIPTAFEGDTKAEENGWEACVLAATLGLFPDDALAPQWFDRLRRFAINSYSHVSDANDDTVIDPAYDQTTVSQLYKGPNLYDDYTLQNHNYFHTSYQNVVIQELGEAALALKLFQTRLYGKEKWQTRALMHHNEEVQTKVLNWLALSDGELAMPNGNDWSLFLYDQITSYTTNATFLRNADALMLERLAYERIRERQATTDDGSWLLRSDIGPRRMGVEGHRVMMSWLMHELMPTYDIVPTDFESFRQRHAEARLLKSQNIVRAYTPDRFTTFSWAPGIKSYTGYIAVNNQSQNNIIVPYKANNSGNFLGWYTVEGRHTNAQPVVSGIYRLEGSAWTMNGELHTNDRSLDHRFVIYSTPGNAVIYLDEVRALQPCTVTREQGGLLAISIDELTRSTRTFYTQSADTGRYAGIPLDGNSHQTWQTPWINIDNTVGVVSSDHAKMAFGDRKDNNSIMTAKLYAAYNDSVRSYQADSLVDARRIVYYSNVDAHATQQMSRELISLDSRLPRGWRGVLADDPDGTQYMLVSNFSGDSIASIHRLTSRKGAPVLRIPTTIEHDAADATFTLQQNHSLSLPIHYYIRGSHVRAMETEGRLNVTALRRTTITVTATGRQPRTVRLRKGETVMLGDE
jgi:hypothetical protein